MEGEAERPSLIQLGEKKAQRGFIAVCSYLVRGYREHGARHVLEVPHDRLRSKKCKLEHEKF